MLSTNPYCSTETIRGCYFPVIALVVCFLLVTIDVLSAQDTVDSTQQESRTTNYYAEIIVSLIEIMYAVIGLLVANAILTLILFVLGLVRCLCPDHCVV